MTLASCNSEVAVYTDSTAGELPAEQMSWLEPFVTDMWQYYEQAYGACSVPRELPAAIGPCEGFGSPKPLRVFLHANGGGDYATIATRFEERSGYHDTLSVAGTGFEETPTLRDVLSHEACHIVEGSGRGVEESPAFEVWGDSKWAEFCLYDMYTNTGRTEDAERVFDEWAGDDNLAPAGATGPVLWWDDWFHPLWVDGGGNAAVMDRFFQLLSQYFPASPSGEYADQGALRYDRRMNVGEYVLFTSAAAGQDLTDRAATAFNTAFDQDEFLQAQQDFPELVTYAP